MKNMKRERGVNTMMKATDFSAYLMDAVLLTNGSGCITDANQAATSLLGYKYEELIDSYLIDLFKENEYGRVQDTIKQAISKGYDQFTAYFRCKNGESINVELTIMQAPHSEAGFFVCLASKLPKANQKQWASP
jgi:PAS domain S-box-containing protein